MKPLITEDSLTRTIRQSIDQGIDWLLMGMLRGLIYEQKGFDAFLRVSSLEKGINHPEKVNGYRIRTIHHDTLSFSVDKRELGALVDLDLVAKSDDGAYGLNELGRQVAQAIVVIHEVQS